MKQYGEKRLQVGRPGSSPGPAGGCHGSQATLLPSEPLLFLLCYGYPLRKPQRTGRAHMGKAKPVHEEHIAFTSLHLGSITFLSLASGGTWQMSNKRMNGQVSE